MGMSESSLNAFSLGAFTAALGVLLGAFGAHALASLPPARMAWWQTGTHYLFIAALGMMLQGLFVRAPLTLRDPALLLAIGALLFSGSLFAMALGAPRALGMITPVGGVALVVGFVLIGIRALRHG
jgi:uncharacterized membrane protein YgdD (TMEM256/DUF423 family)